MKSQNISNGEIRSATKGIMSSRSMELFSKAKLAKLDEEETYNDANSTQKNHAAKKTSSMRDALLAAAKKSSSNEESATTTPKRSGSSSGGSSAAKSGWGNIMNDARRASLEDSTSGSSWVKNRSASISQSDILTEGQHTIAFIYLIRYTYV